MKKLLQLKTMLLLCALIVGSGSAWATTYKLTQVTSVSAGNKYVFERDGHVFNNTVSSGSSTALLTTDTYSTSGLTGTESYVWTLETASGGYYMKNVSLNSSQYLNNSSSTSVSFGSKSSIWTFSFTDGVALIQNKSNSNRFLGDAGKETPNHTYRAYATGNLASYEHEITVYRLDEEFNVTSLDIASSPDNTHYEVGESLDMTGFELTADGNSVTSGYTMTIGSTPINEGDALNSAGKKTITISYGGKEVEQIIYVGAVTSIEVTTAPTKTVYEVGETFDAAGMVVTASFSTSEDVNPETWEKPVTGYTITPSTAFVGSETAVTITYAGQNTTQDITVNAIHVSSVSLNKNTTSITYGGTETLTVTVLPSDANDKSVNWSSNNTFVATVDANGKVTANAVGTATITVTSVDGEKTDQCVVTVTEDTSKPSLVETIFSETFDNCTGTGGSKTGTFSNGNQNGSVSGKTNETWSTITNVLPADHCGRIGTTSTGVLTTTISLTGSATLTFSAAGWKGSDTNTIGVSATGADLSGNTSVTLTNAVWNDYTVNIANATGSVVLTFSGKRGFIDDIVITKPKTIVNVTLSANGYASYCSPFALNLTPTEDYAAYAVTAASSSSVTFTKIPGKVAANIPFILYNEENAGEKVSLPIIEDDDEEIAPVNSNMLAGTLSPTYVTTENGDYTNFGLSGGEFKKITSGVVPANKAYLPVLTDELPASGRLSIVFEEEETGIKSMRDSGKFLDNTVYNLSGQRVENPTKGLYIVNGRKVVVK